MSQLPKMASQFQKAKFVLWCRELNYVVTVENIYFFGGVC